MVDAPHHGAPGPAADVSKAPQADEGVLTELVRRLVAELRPERIYLFGSRARGDATEDSDYDLMILVPYPVERTYPLEVQALRALRDLHLPVDTLVMNREYFEWLSGAAASLPATVKREGRLLYAA